VVRVGHIIVYVYREEDEPHSRPHCNVRWSGNSANFAIDGDEPELLNSSKGARITSAIVDAVIAHYGLIRAGWNQLNPKRQINE
jgi:hypothetical protein